jgi:PQQ-dependent catabolism-associated CXXCW motif protein
MRARRSVAALLLLSLSGATIAGDVEEPAGYRFEPYRAPTPRGLAGAATLDTPAAERMWRERSALYIDVMPHEARPANLPAGTVWRDRRRDNIPGSIWLTNVGFGALSEERETYFRRSLEELTAGDRSRALVFYCQMNCWMSWNAAKRAIALGYGRVHWYPDGTDGWAAAGLPLAEAQPRP